MAEHIQMLMEDTTPYGKQALLDQQYLLNIMIQNTLTEDTFSALREKANWLVGKITDYTAAEEPNINIPQQIRDYIATENQEVIAVP